MENVAHIFAQCACPLSFEIFPPKGDLTLETAQSVAAELAKLDPQFMSVTYSAGGSGNSQATADVADMIQSKFNIPVVAHLTCAHATKSSLESALCDLKQKGIKTVLALRGDIITPAPSAPAFPQTSISDTRASSCACVSQESRAFRYAKDIIPLLVDEGFCVGAAAYPEGHIACTSQEANIEHLKQKQDAGASFFITQLFFDNVYYYRFWEAALAAGITAPITCGIMPFLSKAQIQRMVFMCGASLPSPIIKLLAKYENSPDDLRKAGIDYASEQLLDLSRHGVDGLHIYTMNQPDIACAHVQALHTVRS